MILDQFGRPVRRAPEFPVPEWVTREVMAKLTRDANALLAFNAAANGRGPVLDASGRYASVNLRLIATCETCAHRVDVTGWEDGAAAVVHQCRRYPPTDKVFTTVGLGQWCGEHKPTA